MKVAPKEIPARQPGRRPVEFDPPNSDGRPHGLLHQVEMTTLFPAFVLPLSAAQLLLARGKQ